MRVLLASTSEELEPYREAAREVARELGWEVLPEEPDRDGVPNVKAYSLRVDHADILLAIVGWRHAEVPGPDLGGDGRRSLTQWETRRAFMRGKPVLVLMADETWPPDLREEDRSAAAWLTDFRGELSRLAVFFDHEAPVDGNGPPLTRFRGRVRELLLRHQQVASGQHGPGERQKTLRLRHWPPLELPERPYPVLLPYVHPDLLGGRDRELAELRQLLYLPVPILGVYAPSGVGKSSLLLAGLIPELRAAGQPVAYDRYPHEPGLASRLIGDLLNHDDGDDEDDPQVFVDRLIAVARLAGAVPVLVLDQFEELLGRDDRRRQRARIGTFLAASARRQPECDGPPCRWILAYRQESHGAVFMWLADVLREARAEHLPDVDLLPHNLAGAERFHSWPLPPLGSPPPGTRDPLEGAVEAFQAAIEKPLTPTAEGGGPRYPWRFARDAATRLARAFGEARVARPRAPLAPELQVVLAHLLEGAALLEDTAAAESGAVAENGTVAEIEVPAEPGRLIDKALEEHLRRALDAAFPSNPGASVLQGRTRALLALRELADASGRRDQGLPADELARAIGGAGNEVLEKLATPLTRLVVLEEQPGGWSYALSHDRMAEVIVQVVEEEARHGRLAVDSKLLGLRRFVALNTELFRSGEPEQATRVPRRHFQSIAAHADALLWDDDRRRWWTACGERWREERRRRVSGWLAAALVLALVATGAWLWASRRASVQALHEQLATAEPGVALAALDQLAAAPGADLDEVRARLDRRENPMDVLEHGVAGIGDDERAAAVLRAAEIVLPLIEQAPEDPVRLASLLWALDFFPGRETARVTRTRELRDAALAPLRRRRPAPPFPGPDDPEWAHIAGGTFLMGASDDDGEASESERPQHSVSVTAFRILRHEVTNAEYRRLVPAHAGTDSLPTVRLSWHQAYVYSAWLGGRLPTEAEWEYAARAGCLHTFCDRNGQETTLDAVGWYRGNTLDLETHDLEASTAGNRQPVMGLEPNRWGLFDMHGNVWEWIADWFGEYGGTPRHDPFGPIEGLYRITRGGSFWNPPHRSRVSHRTKWLPNDISRNVGFRVVLEEHSSSPPKASQETLDTVQDR